MNKMIAVVSCFMLFGCAAGGTGAGKSTDANTQEQVSAKIAALSAQESVGLQPVQAAGDLKISVLSKGAPKTKKMQGEEKTRYELDIPIGEGAEMNCYLTEGMGFSSANVKGLYTSISKLPTIASIQVKTINADIFKNIGYIYIEAEYLTKDKAYGSAKVISASSMNVTFNCILDDLGYQKTFMKVAESIAQSDYVQKFIKDYDGYDKKQIDIVSVNNKAVGFAESYQFTDDKKTERRVGVSSTVIPRTANEFMNIESIEKAVYSKDTGQLKSGAYYSYQNDEEEYQIALEQVSGKKYHVQGELKGQKFDQTFESERPMVYSGYLLDQYSAGKISKPEQNFEDYVTLSPTKPVKSKLVLKEKMANGNKKIEYSFPPAKANLELDGKSYTKMDLDMGGVTLLMKRVYFDGR